MLSSEIIELVRALSEARFHAPGRALAHRVQAVGQQRGGLADARLLAWRDQGLQGVMDVADI